MHKNTNRRAQIHTKKCKVYFYYKWVWANLLLSSSKFSCIRHRNPPRVSYNPQDLLMRVWGAGYDYCSAWLLGIGVLRRRLIANTVFRWRCICTQRRAEGGWARCRWPPARPGTSPLVCSGVDTWGPWKTLSVTRLTSKKSDYYSYRGCSGVHRPASFFSYY